MPSLAPPSTRPSARAHPLSLRGLLAVQPDATLERLLARRRVEIDPGKQLDAHEQAARGLAFLPRTTVEHLGAAAREALELLVTAPGWRPRRELGGGGLALVEAGLALSLRQEGELDALAVPAAYRLQLPAPRAESRHAARGLLATLDAETRDDIALTLLGRRTSGAWPLAIEQALLTLETPASLDRAIAELDRTALLALSAIEARGGEVSLDELLDLCREPARWTGARVPRRGAAFHLVSHALVVPGGERRFVLPDEVAERIGHERRSALAARRHQAIEETSRREDEPQRAALSTPCAPRALAAWLAAARDLSREGGPRKALGRGAIARASRATAMPFDQVQLLLSLADATALRGHTLESYEHALLTTWRTGQAWDELLESPLIVGTSPLETPTLILRACAIDALASLPQGRFAPRASVRVAIESDLRFDGVRTAFARTRSPHGPAWVAELGVGLDRLLDVSLPALGLVDVASDGSLRATTRTTPPAATTPLAAVSRTPSLTWLDLDRARLSPDSSLELLSMLAGTADGVAEDDSLLLVVDPSRVTLDARDRWLAALERAGHRDVGSLADRVVRPRGHAVALRASWVITLPSAELASELSALPELQRWLVSPHPEGPLLVFDESAPRAAVLKALSRAGLSVAFPAPSRPSSRPRPIR